MVADQIDQYIERWDEDYLGEYAPLVHETIEVYDFGDFRSRPGFDQDEAHIDPITKLSIRNILETLADGTGRELYGFVRDHELVGEYGAGEESGIAVIELVHETRFDGGTVGERVDGLVRAGLLDRERYAPVDEMVFYGEDRYEGYDDRLDANDLPGSYGRTEPLVRCAELEESTEKLVDDLLAGATGLDHVPDDVSYA